MFFFSGHDLELSEDEEIVNRMLMKSKEQELDQAYIDLDFPPSNNFFVTKDKIQQSDVYKIIKVMPKGKFRLWLFYKSNKYKLMIVNIAILFIF